MLGMVAAVAVSDHFFLSWEVPINHSQRFIFVVFLGSCSIRPLRTS